MYYSKMELTKNGLHFKLCLYIMESALGAFMCVVLSCVRM